MPPRRAGSLSVFIFAGCASFASAQPVIDGSAAGDAYGPPLSIQNTNTQFGNSTAGDPRLASGSEIDQVFGVVAGDRLYVLVTGNLDSNFHRLEVFIDSAPGGVHRLDGPSLPGGADPFCCGGFPPPDGNNIDNIGALQRLHGLEFDAGFLADRYLAFSNGSEVVGSPGLFFWSLSAHYADLTDGTAGRTVAAGMQLNAFGQEPGLPRGEPVDRDNNAWSSPTDFAALPAEHEAAEPVIPGTNNARSHRDYQNTIGLRLALDNSNVAGVSGAGPYTDPTTGNPEAVHTGLEFSIPLSELGNPPPSPGAAIKLVAFITGVGHDFVSNQFAGAGLLSGNPGSTDWNLNDHPGDQYVTITVPPPCPADLDGNDTVNVFDLLIYLDQWFAHDAAADRTGEGTIDVFDLLEYLDDWFTGC